MPLDEVVQHRGTPAARGIARRLRTRLNQGSKGLAWRFGQLRRPPWRTLLDHTGDPAPEKAGEGVADGLRTQGQHLCDLVYRHAISHGQQCMDTLDQAQRAARIRLVKPTRELWTHTGREAYCKRHERYLLPRVAWLGCRAIGMPYLSCWV